MVHPDSDGRHCPCDWSSNWSMTCTGCRGNWLIIIMILLARAHCHAAEMRPSDCRDRLRLSGGTNQSGHVQLLWGSNWHDVCSQDWDDGIGAVLCSHLGFHSFDGFGNGSRDMEELNGEKYETYARCKGTEACLSHCEGHTWQRAVVNAPTPRGIAPCYLTPGPVLQCSDSETLASADTVNSTTMAARSDGFKMADNTYGYIQEGRHHEDCPNRRHTRTGSDSVGRITSPFYPRFYPGQTHCRWKIEVHHSQQVELVVIDFVTEKDRDFLSIYEGRISQTGFSRVVRLHGNLTGNGSVLTFQSSSSVVYLDFRSDEYINARGFLIEYSATPPLSDANKTTITEKRQLGLTVRDVILLSLGMLLLLLLSLGTLFIWRRKTRRQKIGVMSHHKDVPFELEACDTEHCTSTRSHHKRTRYFRDAKKPGNTDNGLKDTPSCGPDIAVVLSPRGTMSCETCVDNLNCNRLSESLKGQQKGRITTDGLILDSSGVATLCPVEC